MEKAGIEKHQSVDAEGTFRQTANAHMNLQLDPSAAPAYKSACQSVRSITESWVEKNLYCAACRSPRLERAKTNAEVLDFLCPSCEAPYELKSGKRRNERRIPDGAYDAMMRRLHSDSVPNLLVLHYGKAWTVENLLLVPSFFFWPSVVERRKPLALSARRSGWVGCNLFLDAIPDDGKIRVVEGGLPVRPNEVRRRYEASRGFSELPASVRGWTLATLKIVRSLQKETFSLAEIYAAEAVLAAAFPGNRNLRAKIRQQLQVLRDMGFLEFRGRGHYRTRK